MNCKVFLLLVVLNVCWTQAKFPSKNLREAERARKIFVRTPEEEVVGIPLFHDYTPVDFFARYDEESEASYAHPNKVLASALEKLMKKSNTGLTELDVLACMSDQRTCATEGSIQNIKYEYPVRYEETNEFRKSDVGGTCGQIVDIEPSQSMVIELNNHGINECNVFVKTKGDDDKTYYLDFVDQPKFDFKDCSEHSLTITQRGKIRVDKIVNFNNTEYTQKYCGGSYFITEFPYESNYALLTYVNTVDFSSSIKLRIRSVEVKVPKLPYIEAIKRLNYTVPYIAHPFLSGPETEVTTFDPKYAEFQECPIECGSPASRTTKVPAYPVAGTAYEPVKKSDFPWYVVVTVSVNGQKRHYGGSVINSRTILTAANYLTHLAGDDIYVDSRPSTKRVMTGPDGRFSKVIKVNIHPDFKRMEKITEDSQKFRHDIAVLHLETPLKMGSEVSPICMAPPNDFYANLVHTLRPVNQAGFEYLAESYSIIWSKEIVEENLAVQYPEEILCHSYHDNLKIQENIGAPVMIRMRNNWFQVGIMSEYFTWSSNTTTMRYSTNVFKYYDFIADNTFTDTSVEDGLCL